MITKSPVDKQQKLARDLASTQRRKKGLADQIPVLADEAIPAIEPHELEIQEKSIERVQVAQMGLEATVIDAAATGAASGAAGGAAAGTAGAAGAGAAGAAAGAGAGAAATSVSVLTGTTAGIAAAGAGVAGAAAGGGGSGAGSGSTVGGGTLPTFLRAPTDSVSGVLSPNPIVTTQRWTSNGPPASGYPYTVFGPMAGSDPYVLDGSECNDTLIGGGGNDTLYGRGGNDRLLGGGGKDQMDGGDGIDTVDYSYLSGANDASLTGYSVKVELRRSNKPSQLVYDADGNPVSNDADSLSNIENVIGSRGNDTITGDKAGNVLDGGRGNDLIFGDNPRDTQRDRIGDTFNDTIVAAGGGNDTIDGMFGINTISFRAVDVTNSPLFDNYDPAWALVNTGDAALLTAADVSPGNALSRSVVIDLASQANTDGFRTYYFTQNPSGITSAEYTSIGLYKNINNVVGSNVSDLIAGDSGANNLNGAGGVDIIYGGGGRDSLYGGEGDDWVVFKPVMGGSSVSSAAYNGITAKLDTQIYASGAITDRPLVGFTNVLGSDGNDRIIGANRHTGVLADFAALKEYDEVSFVFNAVDRSITIGSGAQTAATIQASVDAKVGASKIVVTESTDGSLVFTVNSLADSLTSLQASLYTDNCRDEIGRVIYGDISSANNILVGAGGRDVIFGGDGTDRLFGGATAGQGYNPSYMNSLWGGAGDDTFFIGFDYNPVNGTLASSSTGALPLGDVDADTGMVRLAGRDGATNLDYHDFIQDWQSGDRLFLARDWTVVINGLRTDDSRFSIDSNYVVTESNYSWSGSDTVDLRSVNGVIGDNKNKFETDFGKIVVVSGDGDDTIYGSNGNDWIYAGKGQNLIDLGSVAATGVGGDGADRVYINEYFGKYEVRGFDADDKIYIDGKMLSGFFQGALGSRYIGPTDEGSAGARDYRDGATGASITAGEAYDESFLFPLSKVIWDSSYRSYLSAYSSVDPSDPDDFGLVNGPLPLGWTSNGAWNNAAHYAAGAFGTSAIAATAYGFFIVGNAVAFIPFVGPIIAIPFYVTAGLMTADAVINTNEHKNGVYTLSGGADIDTYITSFAPGVSRTSNLEGWDNINLLDFYNLPTDRFVRTLEVSSQPNNKGLGTLVTVYNGTETFLYLVYSKDSLIQDNEVILLAQINGNVGFDQLVIYDPSTDPYAQGSPAPVFPSEVTTIEFYSDAGKINDLTTSLDQEPTPENPTPDPLLVPVGKITKDTTPEVKIYFDRTLVVGEHVEVFVEIDGAAPVSASSFTVTASTPTGPYAFTYDSEVEDGEEKELGFSVVVTSASGFKSTSPTFYVKVDLKAPEITSITYSETGVTVSTTEDGSVALLKAGPSTVLTGNTSGQSATLSLDAQASVTEITTLKLTDLIGNERDIASQTGTDDKLFRTIVLGSSVAGADTIDYQMAPTTDSLAIYGFAGNDTIKAGGGSDYIFGGSGNDIIDGGNGNDFLYGGEGNDTILGGSGNDVLNGGLGDDSIDGGDGDDTVDYSDALMSDGTALSASDTGITLTLNGGTNATVSAGSTNVGSDTVKNVENIIGTAGKDTLTGDNLANSISGGDGDDTIVGGGGNDTITGGTGADLLTGGAGVDTFVFASGDSGAISGTIFDVITDYEIGVNADLLDLAGSAFVQANNSGVDVSSAAVGTGFVITGSIMNGIISVGGTNSAEINTLAEWLAVARLMVVDNGGVGAFEYGGDTYVFQENTGTNTDLLIQLDNLTGVTAISTTAAANTVLIV